VAVPTPRTRERSTCAAAFLIMLSLHLASTGVAQQTNNPPAAEPIVLNLATAAKSDTMQVVPGRYSFTLTNRIPTADYRVHFGEVPVEIEALPAFSGKDFVAGCEKIAAKVSGLEQIKREADVPKAIDAFHDEAAVEGVRTSCADDVELGESLVARTSAAAGEWTVRRGFLLIVTVSRISSGSTTAEQWKFVFTPGARGAWRITYGFAFPILRGVADGGVFGNQERFFARQVGDKFVVTEGRARRDFDAVPTVFYSFIPSGDAGWRWNALTAGLGLDITKPMVLLGTGVTYNDNILLTAGLGARQEAALLGRYQPGDTLTSNLSEEQLTEQVFRFRPFVSATFRFRTNPFGSGGSGTSAPPADKNPPGQPPKKETAQATPAQP
jgi:hypothetical protein